MKRRLDLLAGLTAPAAPMPSMAWLYDLARDVPEVARRLAAVNVACEVGADQHEIERRIEALEAVLADVWHGGPAA